MRKSKAFIEAQKKIEIRHEILNQKDKKEKEFPNKQPKLGPKMLLEKLLNENEKVNIALSKFFKEFGIYDKEEFKDLMVSFTPEGRKEEIKKELEGRYDRER